MKLPKEQKEGIINGLLPLLGPALEEGTEMMEVSGNTLINNGVKKDIAKKPIIGGKKYLYPVEKMVPVDHKLKLEVLIDQAKDFEDLVAKAGDYLSKHAISKTEVQNFKPNKY